MCAHMTTEAGSSIYRPFRQHRKPYEKHGITSGNPNIR